MKMDKEYQKKLKEFYQKEPFTSENINLAEIDDLINDTELKNVIQLNNAEMTQMLNQKPLDKDAIKKLLIANINFYKLAKYRGINVHGTSFIMTMATAIGYDINRVYDALNDGYNNHSHK